MLPSHIFKWYFYLWLDYNFGKNLIYIGFINHIVNIVMIVPEELYDNSRRIVRIKSNNIIIVLEELIVLYLYDSLEGEIVWNKYESYWSMSDIGVEFLLINFP